MGIFRQDGKWRVRVFSGGKVVADKRFDTKTKALEFHAKTKALTKSNEDTLPEFTFEDLLEKFKALHFPTVRRGTVVAYEKRIERLKPFLRYRKLTDLNAGLLEEVKAKLKESGLEPKTVNDTLHVLRLMLNKAVKWQMLRNSPYRLDSLKVVKKPYKWWEDREDLRKFVAEARRSSRYFAAFVTVIETGLRPGEVVGLSKQDVDFAKGQIHVWRQWLEDPGDYGPRKRDLESWIDFDPKSTLGVALRDAIRTSKDAEAIFVTATGRRVSPRKLTEYVKKTAKKAGVTPLPLRSIRHTFASWFMIERDDIWDLKERLGHANIRTTQIYAHHSSRQRREPLNLIDGVPKSSRSFELRPVSSEENNEDQSGGKETRNQNGIAKLSSKIS